MIPLEPFDHDQARRLRAEAHDMARAYANALTSALSRESIVGIYAKGSAYRPWDSVIDYVPELSDVDVHVHIADDRHAVGTLDDLTVALEIGMRALGTFSALHPSATHVPRPQLMSLAELEKHAGYLPSPEGTVHTLFGEPYPGADRDRYSAVGEDDVTGFLVDADFVRDELPSKVVDRPGRRWWDPVSRLTWRVAPAGPRLLTRLGVNPFDAWSMNRTSIVRSLLGLGRDDLAEAYADFYLAGWDGFRSGFEDADAARRALLAADRLFHLGREAVGRRRVEVE